MPPDELAPEPLLCAPPSWPCRSTVGRRVNLDVLNAQTQLFSTQRDLAKARYDVLVNSLKLRQAAGVLTASDIDGVNALLSAK